MNKTDKLTAWMFCRECARFDNGEHPDRPCSGKAFDYEVKNDVEFMLECDYEYDESLLKIRK